MRMKVTKPMKILHDGEHLARIEKAKLEQAESARNEKSKENISQILKQAESQAESAKNINIHNHGDNEPDTVVGVQQLLKTEAYRHTLRSIRRKLPKPARLFSKVAHNSTIESISEVSAKTIARPSGFLGGSIFSFTGSLVLLYMSRHYGFSYNYATFFILFVLGFIAGAAAELAFWALYSRKHRH